MSNGRQLSSRAVAGSAARQRLEQLKSAGVEWVRTLGSGMPGADCDYPVTLEDAVFQIDVVPALPLPGCEREDCKCTWVPAEPPPEPKL